MANPRFWRLARNTVSLLSAASILTACVSREPVSQAAPAETIAQLTHQSEAWDKAIVRKDKAAIAGNMSEDFRQISSSGEVSDKKTFVDNLTSDDLVIDPYTVEDFNIRLYGDVALLSGRTHMTGRGNGEPFKTQYIYIDIYRRVAGNWKVCSVQTTRLPS
jgi:ketosteroid isomerase-like protein